MHQRQHYRITDPLGVCSVAKDGSVTVTCPVRFRQDWLIAVNAAAFFFPGHTIWSAIPEVRLPDKMGQSAGNLDLVIVAQDSAGHILDFGAVEVQAVYISGNVRVPFRRYMADPEAYLIDESSQTNIRPDYLSSSRKRLAPQLIYKGGILKAWGKHLAVVMQEQFFATLPVLPSVPERDADIAWMLYDLQADEIDNRLHLVHSRSVYTEFQAALDRLVTSEAGQLEDFVASLQRTLEQKKIRTEGKDLS